MLGFLLVDKPKGINSFKVVSVLRKVCNLRRIGYAGTLDPLASGLMLVAISEATKLLAYLDKMDKVYEATIRLGAISETYDAEGPITETKNVHKVERSHIIKILEDHFSGEQLQKPPAYSAVQIKGKRAYALARKGMKVDLKSRKVSFFEVKLKHYSWPHLTCTVHCSSGTYVRSFAHDLGKILGTGAYLEELRRTKIGHYSVQDSVTLSELSPQNVQRYFLEPQVFLSDWAQLHLNEPDYRTLAQGGYIANGGEYSGDPILALYKEKSVGIVETVQAGKKLKFAKRFIVDV